MENISTEEVIDKLDMFQARFGKVDECGWQDMQIIKTGAGIQFTYKEFQEGLIVRGVRLSLSAPDYQEMNGQVEVTWLTLRTIAHSIMVRTQVSDKYIHFTLMYMNDHILPGLPTRHLVTQDKKIIPHKLEKIFSIKTTCFILSMCCTKGNCTFLRKGVKHMSSITKGFLLHLGWNSTTSKRVPHLCAQNTDNSFFT